MPIVKGVKGLRIFCLVMLKCYRITGEDGHTIGKFVSKSLQPNITVRIKHLACYVMYLLYLTGKEQTDGRNLEMEEWTQRRSFIRKKRLTAQDNNRKKTF